jgi:hypothetical protein
MMVTYAVPQKKAATRLPFYFVIEVHDDYFLDPPSHDHLPEAEGDFFFKYALIS